MEESLYEECLAEQGPSAPYFYMSTGEDVALPLMTCGGCVEVYNTSDRVIEVHGSGPTATLRADERVVFGNPPPDRREPSETSTLITLDARIYEDMRDEISTLRRQLAEKTARCVEMDSYLAQLLLPSKDVTAQHQTENATYTVFATNPTTVQIDPKHTPADVKPNPEPKKFPAGALKTNFADRRMIGR